MFLIAQSANTISIPWLTEGRIVTIFIVYIALFVFFEVFLRKTDRYDGDEPLFILHLTISIAMFLATIFAFISTLFKERAEEVTSHVVLNLSFLVIGLIFMAVALGKKVADDGGII